MIKLENPLLNKSEIARQMVISRASFENKNNKKIFNKFSLGELMLLKKICEELIADLQKNIASIELIYETERN